MRDSEGDSVDRALIDALAMRPRTSWSALASILSADAGTLARRWRRLSEQGLARIAVEPGPRAAAVVAVIEVECAPSALQRITAQLQEQAPVLSVDVTTGARDLVVVAGATDAEEISDLVVDRLVELPGVRAMRVAVGALVDDGIVQFRVRLAPGFSRGRVIVWLFGKAAPGRVGSALSVLHARHPLRFAASVHGRFDIAVCLRLRTIDDVPAVLEELGEQVPGVRFVDRSIVLRSGFPMPA